MKKTLLLGMMAALVGCGGAPEPTGDIEADLKAMYEAQKVETLGDQLIITMPFADAASESDMVLMSFNNMSNSLNYIMDQHPNIDAKKIYYMYQAELTGVDGSTSNENLMGVIFNIDDLKKAYYGKELPFQMYLPYADMDYKQSIGRAAVQSWCDNQDNNSDYMNVCP